MSNELLYLVLKEEFGEAAMIPFAKIVSRLFELECKSRVDNKIWTIETIELDYDSEWWKQKFKELVNEDIEVTGKVS